MTTEAPRRVRRRTPWADDFQGVQDRLSTALGCEVRWFAEYGEIHARTDAGMELLVDGLPERRDAYFWMRGRLSGEERGDD